MHMTIDELKAKLLEEELKDMFRMAYEQGLHDAQTKHSLPPLMTRKQFMEFADIGSSKCNELFNRRDFPINREFGHPRVPTKQLFKWIELHTEWVREHAPGLTAL